jgi:hypothetical protein
LSASCCSSLCGADAPLHEASPEASASSFHQTLRGWRQGHRRAAIGSTRVLTVLSLANRFDLVARFYRTDKSSLSNNYSPHYQRHLGPIRFEKNVVLELGVGGTTNRYAGGNSLHLWRDYMPRATIVGLDLHAKELPFLGRRVHVVQGNQASPDDLGRILERFGPPNVVIDDGSHVGTDVIASFTYLFDRMRPGGIYVIEDLFFSFEEKYSGSEDPGPGTALGLLDELLRSVQRGHGHMAERAKPDSSLPELGGRAATARRMAGIAAVHVYPGIAFIKRVDP